MKPWNYLLLLLVPALMVVGWWLGDWWNFLVPVTCFVIYPLINLCFKANVVSEPEGRHIYPSWMYRLLVTIFVLVLISLTTGALVIASEYKVFSLSFIGLCLSI